VGRAIAILRAFTPRAQILRLSQISHLARLDKGTTRRILLTLREGGLVEQDETTHLYSLGMGALELASAVQDSRGLREQARVVLSELAGRTGTTGFLGVHRQGEAVCLERVDGNQPVQIRAWSVGARLPLNCGGAPRVLLAFLPESEIKRVIQRGLVTLTPKSQTDPAALLRDLARIRSRGWELAVDDVTLGLAAVAVAVRNTKGDVVAAISLAGLTQHLRDRRRPRFLPALRSAADKLGTRI
jgi:DNA-binding IclR family transcriptional regulator